MFFSFLVINKFKLIGITKHIKTFKGKGCVKCNQTGHKGRHGVYEILKVTPPPERAAGIIVDSVDELIDKLKNEAKVI